MFDVKEEELQRLERTTPGDVFTRESEAQVAAWAPGGDGIPDRLGDQTHHYVPPLVPETFVCMADESRYVLRSAHGIELATISATDVELAGSRRLVDASRLLEILEDQRFDGRMTQAETLARIWDELTLPGPAAVERDLARRLRRLGADRRHVVALGMVTVLPVREPCRHYCRMRMDLPNSSDPAIERLCTAQRAENGLLMSVRDMRMLACELRDPPDVACMADLDARDQLLVALGRERLAEQDQQLEEFDVEAALQEAENGTAEEVQ